ncbi:hypothetical protein [Mycobacteroides salmoniphilum]|uniref:hypothetical protein n=1 Tax=Mycobacteroides salmoniphilum TaxID=404941 RepID=UPI0012FF7C2D|nr:hypothetical protein [Mycobacteroides salmoniphilum]
MTKAVNAVNIDACDLPYLNSNFAALRTVSVSETAKYVARRLTDMRHDAVQKHGVDVAVISSPGNLVMAEKSFEALIDWPTRVCVVDIFRLQKFLSEETYS